MATSFYAPEFFYPTVVYFLLIYASLTICAENLFLLRPLIAMLSTETAAFFAFRLLRRQLVCFWMHSDVHFCFSSLSFSLSSASPSFIVARHGLFILSLLLLPSLSCHSVVYFAFLSPLCRLLSRFVVSSSASHSFTSACRRHLRPATSFYFSF